MVPFPPLAGAPPLHRDPSLQRCAASGAGHLDPAAGSEGWWCWAPWRRGCWRDAPGSSHHRSLTQLRAGAHRLLRANRIRTLPIRFSLEAGETAG